NISRPQMPLWKIPKSRRESRSRRKRLSRGFQSSCEPSSGNSSGTCLISLNQVADLLRCLADAGPAANDREITKYLEIGCNEAADKYRFRLRGTAVPIYGLRMGCGDCQQRTKRIALSVR